MHSEEKRVYVSRARVTITIEWPRADGAKGRSQHITVEAPEGCVPGDFRFGFERESSPSAPLGELSKRPPVGEPQKIPWHNPPVRSDEQAKEAIREALRRAPKGLGRDALRAAAGVNTDRLAKIQREMLFSGEVRKHKRKICLHEARKSTPHEAPEAAVQRAHPAQEYTSSCVFLRQWRDELGVQRAAQLLENCPGSIVYFVQGANGGPIKIGTTTHLAGRLANLQALNAQKLCVLATVPCGGHKLERELHDKFKDDRLHGEWFEPSEHLATWIRDNATVHRPEGCPVYQAKGCAEDEMAHDDDTLSEDEC
jgi:hypothetical protein